MQSIKRFFIFNDWVWSIVLGFLAYWLLNWGPSQIGNVAMTYYAINFVQPLLATGAVMAALMCITRLGLYFYFKKIHNYIWGHWYKTPPPTQGPQDLPPAELAAYQATQKERTFKLFSQEDFKKITPWQKLLFAFFVVASLFAAALLVFLKFLALAGNVTLS